MFEKYKIVRMDDISRDKRIFGISERRFLFFYRPLVFDKVILEPCALPEEVVSIISRERLVFARREQAEDEIDRLGFGEPAISSMIYLRGSLIRVEHDSKR